ncbi:hypothetical protein [Bosea sp. LjRoot237]|uniref:hypothetical protein n=1 Tax=Bosea sp. LjRoot237 TaxID=3342292 RepID=UPI003ECD1C19
MAMSSADVTATLGPVDETLVAEIIATGATRDDLAQAWYWLNCDDALIKAGRPLPSGKVAELADLLSPERDEPDA